jgi:hypothetical protein
VIARIEKREGEQMRKRIGNRRQHIVAGDAKTTTDDLDIDRLLAEVRKVANERRSSKPKPKKGRA